MCTQPKHTLTSLEKQVDQRAVELDALLVDRRALDAARYQTRPRQAEAVRVGAELGHEVDVFFEVVVMVTCHIADVAVYDVSLQHEHRRLRYCTFPQSAFYDIQPFVFQKSTRSEPFT